jgi:multidrug efflux pump
MSEKGFAGFISRGFMKIQLTYGRWLNRTLENRPAVYLVWVCIGLLIIPLFIMSPKELALIEDQGIIFGIVDASANATLDQTSVYAAAVNTVFQSIPETEFTFQITNPSSGFSGMVTRS